MENANEIFSLVMENADLHFIIHQESFSQMSNTGWKALHSHVYYEILYSLSGDNRLILKNREIPLENNSFVVVPPYRNHNAFFEHSTDLFSIGFYYEKNQSKYARNDLYSMLDTLLPEKYNVGIPDEGLRELFLQLQGLNRVSDPISEGLILTVLARILYNILGILRGERDEKESEQEEDISSDNRKPYSPHGISFAVLYQINELLNTQYAKDITPVSLSRELFISPKQINRYIFNQYGQTFLQRRTGLRMTAAQKLLTQTEDPISSISESVGYHSINTFYSAFKTFCGVTPDKYRQRFTRGNTNEQDS